MRRSKLTAILAVVILAMVVFVCGVFAGIDIRHCEDAPRLAEFEFRVAELERYSGDLEDENEYYRLLFDRLRHDKQQVEADIALMVEAIRVIKAERDIYYLEMHRLLNPPEY